MPFIELLYKDPSNVSTAVFQDVFPVDSIKRLGKNSDGKAVVVLTGYQAVSLPIPQTLTTYETYATVKARLASAVSTGTAYATTDEVSAATAAAATSPDSD